MEKLTEPEGIQKLRFLLVGADLIENTMNKGLITPEDKNKFFKTLNDKSHSIIEQALADLG